MHTHTHTKKGKNPWKLTFLNNYRKHLINICNDTQLEKTRVGTGEGLRAHVIHGDLILMLEIEDGQTSWNVSVPQRA